jgi:hypothetical protein
MLTLIEIIIYIVRQYLIRLELIAQDVAYNIVKLFYNIKVQWKVDVKFCNCKLGC